jgi:hypothetical protein
VLERKGRSTRNSRSAFRRNVIDALRLGGFIIEDRQVKARDENRFFSIDLYKFCERGLSAYSRQMNFASASLRADPLSTIKALSLMIQV